MKDFFISYTAADEGWAEWVAWTLEEARFSVVVQKWDFLAGSNFVLEMQRAASEAKRTIALLSPAYLTGSKFGSPEWAAAFAKDPEALLRILVPIRVQPCEVTGLLKSIVYVDFVGVDEATARKQLLDHVRGSRLKPTERPAFPGAEPRDDSEPAFPIGQSHRPEKTAKYMPRIAGRITDQDRRYFIRDTFDLICAYFHSSLEKLREHNPGVDHDFTKIDANSFTAEVFVGGNSRSQCRIWIGGLSGSGNEIAYSEGNWDRTNNSLNEDLGLAEHDGNLFMSAQMGGMFGNNDNDLDVKRLSPEDAAEYLWRRFISRLEH